MEIIAVELFVFVCILAPVLYIVRVGRKTRNTPQDRSATKVDRAKPKDTGVPQ